MKIILDNLEPSLVENLRYQAEQHGRTLETELKLILTQAVTKKCPRKLSETNINSPRNISSTGKRFLR
ncbi:hypothetical protein OA07_11395 [Aphanizomenon flos-aquae 2012/KM1/D3]|uniref:FitA-like ribbon-helix-helix domain-containing protein n=1 Tax=Aphanizomenon flos-aquae TaxID=1176 RepID=UPI00054221C5|nr:hypothetical protein [Aphanizomenon flos-aquae]KHG41437.1 hypothetical protein OA07_11395 [Aphanizomenon flos-aquae 2012/KM1/D3]